MLAPHWGDQPSNGIILTLTLFSFNVSRESLVFVLGLLVFVAPLIGVPPNWKDYALIAIGALLVLIGLSLRRSSYYRKIRRSDNESGSDFFVESSPDIRDHALEEAETDKTI